MPDHHEEAQDGPRDQEGRDDVSSPSNTGHRGQGGASGQADPTPKWPDATDSDLIGPLRKTGPEPIERKINQR